MEAAVATVLLAAAYCNGLDAVFVFDDEPAIVNNASIRGLGDLRTVLRPRAFFPLVAAAILLAPSSAVPVAMQTIAEHRVYLASAAILALVVVGLGAWLAARGDANLFAAVCICLVIACVSRTIVRNREVATATSLWAQNVRDCPENPRGLKNLVGLLIRDGERYDLAEAVARACDELGEFAAAVRLWEPLAESDPALLANLGVSRMQAGQPDAAFAAFEEAVRRLPDDPGMRANLDRARSLIRSRSPPP
jgi:tetratricopeptide (TPR) repeat protein